MARIIEGFNKDASKKMEPPNTSIIKDFLEKEILGQSAAADYWANAIHRILSDAPRLGNGPLLVALEVGPSGCGKTEIVKRVAEFLASYGDGGVAPLIRVDCGEFQEKVAVSRLIGSSPNYAGQEVVPRLAQSEIDRHAITLSNGRKVTVLLFDEIEKAHENLSTALLGTLDYGSITMGNNSITNLKDCIVVFTSNLGNVEIAEQMKSGGFSGFLGAGGKSPTTEDKTHIRHEAIHKRFPSEQLSRMGGEGNTVVFEELSKETVTKILVSKLNRLEQMYATHGSPIDIQLTQIGADKLLELGYTPKQGIRPLVTVLEQKIIPKLTSLPKSDTKIPVVVDVAEGEINLYIPIGMRLTDKTIKRPTVIEIPRQGEDMDSVESKNSKIRSIERMVPGAMVARNWNFGEISTHSQNPPLRPEEGITVRMAPKTNFMLADEIGKAYGFWFLLSYIPDDENKFREVLKKFIDCLQRIEATYGEQFLRQLGAIYINLRGTELRLERSSVGQIVLHTPQHVTASEIHDFILHTFPEGIAK